MNKEILNSEAQRFINDHLNTDINKLLLSKSPFKALSSAELAQQIDGKKRSEKKLPTWFNTPGIYYPPKLNIEQASSEQTAAYKSRLVLGKTLADLTGGFGVDDYFFSQKVEKVSYFERDEELSAITKHNSGILGARNIEFIVGNSIECLKSSNSQFDTIYVDPARRVQSKKVFLLKDTEPDVVENLPMFLERAARTIIKTSPLFDIQSGLNELYNVSEIHVISVKNDCKELIWVIDAAFEAEPVVHCAALSSGVEQNFSFTLSAEKELKQVDFSMPSNYLFEPDVALLKAGGFKSISNQYKLSKLNVNTHLYTSKDPMPGFIGRSFEVKDVKTYSQFSKDNKIKKANIISRNFPMSPEELKKKHKVQDGGEDFLIFCKGPSDNLLTIHTIKVQQ
ncbi:THUMP-like domain-containing protein [Desertivirga brevis]|uniref:THUMP-like domain-containing protein n=1 Tax=Desertivirga brevis TaxID=2810310 RepID=UPI001A95952B|nr:hypothetical protein [Pedobacter sp. SYSU D00873]